MTSGSTFLSTFSTIPCTNSGGCRRYGGSLCWNHGWCRISVIVMRFMGSTSSMRGMRLRASWDRWEGREYMPDLEGTHV